MNVMDTPIRYLEWNYDEGKVREYARVGECNGCGQCCLARIQWQTVTKTHQKPSPPATFNGGQHKNFSSMSNVPMKAGVMHEIRQGKQSRFMTPVEVIPGHECKSLTEDKKCALHEFKNWRRRIMELCDVWPIHPSQVTPFDQCSYEFRLIGEWDIQETSDAAN